jgi:small subunit ribosomal protein S1
MNIEALNDQDSTADDDLPNHSPSSQDLPDQSMGEYLTNGYDYQAPRRGDIRSGVIMEANDQGLVVDIGSKREGWVPAEDLQRLDEETRSEIQPGATFPVFVLRPEGREGNPILSIYQARLRADWLKAEQMMESGEIYEGEVAGYNRGGLIVRFGKIRGFVPSSHIVGLPKRLREEQRRQRLSEMIGQRLGLKVIEVDRQRRRLILSQRRALRAWQELQRERVITQLTEGETRRGMVTSITSFGAFVDLGGADGLIHVSEISWGRVDNPHQVLKVGDELDVYVLDVDRQRKRIALSLKKLQPDPWTIVDDHYRVGQLVEGRVTRVLDFGAFVEVDLGVEGLLHASEMIGTPELNPSDIVHPGETLPVKIIRIDSRRRRLALSARQVRRSEWERWMAERQTAHESQEAAARESEDTGAEIAIGEPVEEEVAVPQAEAAISEIAEEQTPAPEAGAEAAVEEEATTPEMEVGPPVPEAEVVLATSESVEEEIAVPQAEAAISEIAEEQTPAPVAEASAAVEEEAIAPETKVESPVPEAEAVVATSEPVEEEVATLDAEETVVSEASDDEATTTKSGATETIVGEVAADEAAPQIGVPLALEEEVAQPIGAPAPDVTSDVQAMH